MSPEKQNMAIAEACGWKCVHAETYSDGVGGYDYGPRGMPPHSNTRFPIPDYLADLNAMHEAYLTLDINQQRKFCGLLMEASRTQREAINATAAQRAEAFLRTTNKWEDE